MTPTQQIKAAISCGEYIGRYLDVRRGKALCPFHREKTPSLSVHDDYYKCFSCSASGDLITFAAQFHSISTGAAIRMLAEEAGVSLERQPTLTPYDAAKAERTAAECRQWAAQMHAALIGALYADDYGRVLPFVEKYEHLTRVQLMEAYLVQRTPEQAALLREAIRETDLWCKAMTPLLNKLIDRLASCEK